MKKENQYNTESDEIEMNCNERMMQIETRQKPEMHSKWQISRIKRKTWINCLR